MEKLKVQDLTNINVEATAYIIACLIETCEFSTKEIAEHFNVGADLVRKWKYGNFLPSKEHLIKLIVFLGKKAEDVIIYDSTVKWIEMGEEEYVRQLDALLQESVKEKDHISSSILHKAYTDVISPVRKWIEFIILLKYMDDNMMEYFKNVTKYTGPDDDEYIIKTSKYICSLLKEQDEESYKELMSDIKISRLNFCSYFVNAEKGKFAPMPESMQKAWDIYKQEIDKKCEKIRNI